MSQDLAPAVDTVPWDQLQHHYGTAEDVPELLLAAPTDLDAFGELQNKIYHQGGTVLSAAPPVLRFLVHWAEDQPFGPRGPAIDLIGKLARTAREAQPEFVTPEWPAAWSTALPRLLSLLADPDPLVRRQIAFPLAQAHEHAQLVTAALLARWQEEPDDATRLGFVLAVAQLLHDTSGDWPPQVVDWLSALSGHQDPAHRFAASMASRLSGLGGRDPRHVDEVASYLPTADLAVWQNVWCTRRTTARLIWWTNDVLGADRDGRNRTAAALLGSRDPERRASALSSAATLMNRWRSSVGTLLPHVAGHLTDPDPQQRETAASILAATGRAAEPWREELLAACEDDSPTVTQAALHALVRAEAPEAVPLVVDLLDSPHHGLALGCQCGGLRFRRSVPNILTPLRSSAADLLPGIIRRLRSATTTDEQRAFLQVLEAWGPEARAALPDIAAFLGTESEEWALDALIALDSAEARAVALPAVISANELGGTKAAHRCWRVTGDAEVLLHHVRTSGSALSQNVLVLTELGPAAAEFEDELRGLTTSGQRGWAQVGLRHALWRITADREDGLAVADAARWTITSGMVSGSRAIRYIGTLASLGPLAAPVVPALRPLLDTDVRPGSTDQWSSITNDELLCDAVRAILAAAGSAASVA
ncbi:HEAT repeat domain-containing protein [Lentzea sp. NPDC054927]